MAKKQVSITLTMEVDTKYKKAREVIKEIEDGTLSKEIKEEFEEDFTSNKGVKFVSFSIDVNEIK